MYFYIEDHDPIQDLGGLCECLLYDGQQTWQYVDFHIHQHFELLYVLKGELEITVENQSHHLQKGSCALIFPMEPHSTRVRDSAETSYMVLKFTPMALYSVNQPLFELKYISPYLRFSEHRVSIHTAEQLAGSRLDRLLHDIFRERQAEEYGYEMALRAYVCQVLLWFIREWHRTRPGMDMDERSLIRLKEALTYIDDHLSGELRAQDVADHLGMGLSTFSRFFAGTTSMAFPAYVRSQRLRHASQLLVTGNLSIAEIAAQTGFNTASYLILCFRNQYGITPSHFRKMNTSATE